MTAKNLAKQFIFSVRPDKISCSKFNRWHSALLLTRALVDPVCRATLPQHGTVVNLNNNTTLLRRVASLHIRQNTTPSQSTKHLIKNRKHDILPSIKNPSTHPIHLPQNPTLHLPSLPAPLQTRTSAPQNSKKATLGRGSYL